MKTIKMMQKILTNILVVIAIFILISAATCVFLQLKPVVVLSGSMEPTIETGSFALIDKKDKDINAGDIIAYEHQGMQVLHRVIKITKDGYITKGDNNKSEDFYIVSLSSLIGTLKVTVPYLGYMVKWAASTQGIIIIATMCICLFLTGQITLKSRKNNK